MLFYTAKNTDVTERITRFLNDSAAIIEDTTQQWYRSVTSPLDGDTLGMDKSNYDRGFIESCLQSAVDKCTLQADTPVSSLSLQIVSAYYMEYMDLILLHQSLSDYYGSWRALEELYKDGKVRAIGASY